MISHSSYFPVHCFHSGTAAGRFFLSAILRAGARISARKCRRNRQTLPHCSPAHFPLMHAYRPDDFPAQKRHSPVFQEALAEVFSPTRRCRSTASLAFCPRRSPASDPGWKLSSPRSSSAMPSFLPVSCHERPYLIQFSD